MQIRARNLPEVATPVVGVNNDGVIRCVISENITAILAEMVEVTVWRILAGKALARDVFPLREQGIHPRTSDLLVAVAQDWDEEAADPFVTVGGMDTVDLEDIAIRDTVCRGWKETGE